MKFEDHCKESLELFGEEFKEIHKWLDEFAGKPRIGMKHRRFRHHLAGVEEVRRIWGDKAALAAKRHIQSDLKEEGLQENEEIPRDEKDFNRMGFFG